MSDMISTNSTRHATPKEAARRWNLAPLYWLLLLVLAIGGPIYLLSLKGTLAQAGMGLLAIDAGILGMFMKLVVAAFSNSAEETGKQVDNSQIHISNDLKYLAVQINNFQASSEKTPKTVTETSPFEVTARGLVGKDNALALARLRIDIEQELRIISSKRGQDSFAHKGNISLIIADLAQSALLPTLEAQQLNEVIKVCNQAVHGNNISNEDAEAVVIAGSSLLSKLRQMVLVADPPQMNYQSTTN